MDTHGDDLALQSHLHAVERHVGGAAVFDLQAGKPFDCLEVIDQRADRFLAAGDRAVDTLVRKKQRALDAATAAEGGQRRAQGLKAVEPGKLVERGDADWLNFLGCCHAHATRPW